MKKIFKRFKIDSRLAIIITSAAMTIIFCFIAYYLFFFFVAPNIPAYFGFFVK
jgi:hypothetical protein